MKINKISPRGYCKGVIRAINIAKESVKLYPNEKIYILGMLVHNDFVTQALANLGITTLYDSNCSKSALIDQIENGIIILSAHGSSNAIKQQITTKGLRFIDATCPDVLKTHDLINSYAKLAYQILYIGKKNHPESNAIIETFNDVILITSLADIKNISERPKMFLTNQTTMSQDDVKDIINACIVKFKNIVVSEEICNATMVRQNAIKDLTNKNIDILYVVGDPKSNNSNRLAQIAREVGIPNVYLIQSYQDINPLNYTANANIAISSGASTPTYLTNQVIEYFEKNDHQPLPFDWNKVI